MACSELEAIIRFTMATEGMMRAYKEFQEALKHLIEICEKARGG